MDWQEVSLTLQPDQLQAAETLLQQHGCLSLTLTDAGDQPILEPLPDETPLWQDIVLTGLFTADSDLDALTRALSASSLSTAADTLRHRQFGDQDWTRVWMERFKPMAFGSTLWVCPTGQTPPDPNAVNLRLDPGLAFGTGTHETTALCLQFLDQHAPLKAARVLDFGCGSGILAIAALLLGAAQADAVDIDPQAHLATRSNARINGVADRIRLCDAEQLEAGAYGLVMANILAGPLIELAPTLCRLMAPEGRIVISGILFEQASAIQSAYAPFCSDLQITRDNDWIRMTARCTPSA